MKYETNSVAFPGPPCVIAKMMSTMLKEFRVRRMNKIRNGDQEWDRNADEPLERVGAIDLGNFMKIFGDALQTAGRITMPNGYVFRVRDRDGGERL